MALRPAPAQKLSLATGAEARVTNDVGPLVAVFLGGGRAEELPGTWSASNEWLVRGLAPAFPDVGFLEVRYRLRSWRRLELCVEDARAAVLAAVDGGAKRVALVGFSMGGAVAVSAAAEPAVKTVIGLAPWLPDRLPVEPLRGRRFSVIHGALDRSLPGIPGVSAGSSRRGFERARQIAADADYTVIPGAVHGAAVRPPWGLTPLPRARRWAELLGRELERFRRPEEGRASEPAARAES